MAQDIACDGAVQSLIAYVCISQRGYICHSVGALRLWPNVQRSQSDSGTLRRISLWQTQILRRYNCLRMTNRELLKEDG